MTFVETQRATEQYSKSVILLYLRDENGAPVPDARLKIWAGPPPAGEPPYYSDNEPDNRRTDADGRFEFVVASPAPDRELDFYVQVLGSGDTTESEPLHFPFPANSPTAVTVTAAAVPESSEQLLPPVPGLQIDPRLAAKNNVSVEFVEPSANPNYWKLVSARFLDLPPTQDQAVASFYLLDENDAPLPGARVILKLPTGDAIAVTDEAGHARLMLGTDTGFDPARGERGPCSASVDGLPSDTVVGLGLPAGSAIQYMLTWRRVVPEAPQPEPLEGSSVTGQIRNVPPGSVLTLGGGGRTWTSLVGPGGVYGFNALPAGNYALTLAGVGVINGSIELDGKGTVEFDYAVPARPPAKVFAHYLLFGPGDQPATLTNLILALDYIVRFAPIVGFSADEAKNAQRVTIVGDISGVGDAVEQGLRDAGCHVVRLTAADSYALEELFKQLVASGSPYPR
ncbi:MAG: hypothetical protein ACM3JD_08330 [Rudaea sp.]